MAGGNPIAGIGGRHSRLLLGVSHCPMGTVPLLYRVTQAVSGLAKPPKTQWLVSNAESERPLSPCLMSHPGASLFHRAAVSPFHCPAP
jgi:hypothetical protein